MDRTSDYKVLRAVSAIDDTGLAADGAKFSDVSSRLVPLKSSPAGASATSITSKPMKALVTYQE